MPSHFLITTFIQTPKYASALQAALSSEAYDVVWNQEVNDFLAVVAKNNPKIDCLLVEQTPSLVELLTELKTQKILLPTVMIEADELSETVIDIGSPPFSEQTLSSDSIENSSRPYHSAVVHVSESGLDKIDRSIHQAIDCFLQLPASLKVNELEASAGTDRADSPKDMENSGLAKQQKRLAEKLKERLGYLGVYYKRNPQNFFRSMTRVERHQFLEQLSSDYREIILGYFSKDNMLNQKIDSYVNAAFFADIAVSQVVEIHMDLMDSFSKQLQLEGRSEDILLDYRLTLIDVIAHLCEMYRRSIPRVTDG
ncbi:MAG: circadian clock protein KaiA [Cyanobacteria bacterium J06639_16]